MSKTPGKGVENKKSVYNGFNCIIDLSFSVLVRSRLIMIQLMLRFQLR